MALNVFKIIVICQSVYFIFILAKIILRILGLTEKTIRVEAQAY